MSDHKLAALKAHAANARELELDIKNAEQTLSDLKSKLNTLYQHTIPTLLDEIGINNIGLAAEGNKPAVNYKIRNFYQAAIPASWSEERKAAAFDFLKSVNAESLIKTEVSMKLPKGELKLALKLVEAAKKLKVTADLKQSVHGATLSAWLRELYEKHDQSLTQEQLEAIGAYVGRVVKPVDIED